MIGEDAVESASISPTERYLSLRKGNSETAAHLAIATIVVWRKSLDCDRFITLSSGGESIMGLLVDDLGLLRTNVALSALSVLLLIKLLDTCHDDVGLDSHFTSTLFCDQDGWSPPRRRTPFEPWCPTTGGSQEPFPTPRAQERGPQDFSPDGDATNFLESVLAESEEVDVSRTAKTILLGLQDAASEEVLLLALDVEREHRINHVLKDV